MHLTDVYGTTRLHQMSGQPGIILPDKPIADHEGIFIDLNIKTCRLSPTTKTIRQDKNLDPASFLSDLTNQPFHLIYQLCEPNTMLSKLNHFLLTTINKHAPLKLITVRKSPAPWIDNDIKKLIAKRNKLYRLAKQSNLTTDMATLSTISKKLKAVLSDAKQSFINKCLTNPNLKVWNVINKLLKPSSKPITHDLNDLNTHFASTSERVTGIKPQPISTPDAKGTLSFSHTNTNQVLSIINKLRPECATGADLIPAKYLKLSAHIIAPHLTNIINTSLDLNIFPDAWKVSRIAPVPKVDCPTSMDDYRPISILPILSKIFEKIIITQLIGFIDNAKLYPDTLSGCRKGHSTVTALMHIKDTCLKALKANEITILGLVDFSKAFDTLNFSTLLNTLSTNNFSSAAINLFKSYLSNRKQFIQHSNKNSNLTDVVSGVPQGSLLGPILFNLYVASLNSKITATEATHVNYVDDFQLVHHGKPTQLTNISQKMKCSIELLTKEASKLDLQFNAKKTKFLLIATKKTATKHNLYEALPQINLSVTSISRTSSHKNLGVHFDQHLNFHTHHTESLKRAYATLSSLRPLKFTLSTKDKLLLIESLLFSTLSYANAITFPTNKYWTSKYNKFFKSAISFAYNRYISSSDLKSISILNFHSRWKLSILSLAYKSLYFDNFAPYLRLSLQTNSRYPLRSQSAPLIELPKNLDGSFADHATKLFNCLPDTTRSLQGEMYFKTFKTQVKNILLADQAAL